MDGSQDESLAEGRDRPGQDEAAASALAGAQPDTGHDPLVQIHTGMLVFDREGTQLGTVDGVFHGRSEDEAVAAPGRARPVEDGTAERASAGPPEEGQAPAGRGETLGDYQTPPGTPPPVETSDQGLQAALGKPQMRRVFIRLGGTDLPEGASYVALEQIERSDDLRVYLNASRDELAAAG